MAQQFDLVSSYGRGLVAGNQLQELAYRRDQRAQRDTARNALSDFLISGNDQSLDALKQAAPEQYVALRNQQFRQQALESRAANEQSEQAHRKNAENAVMVKSALTNGDIPAAANIIQGMEDSPAKQQALEALQSGNIEPVLGMADQLINVSTRLGYLKSEPDNTPSSIREYQFARSQGYNGSFNEFQNQHAASGASRISVDAGGRPLPYKLPNNYMLRDPNNPASGVVPIPGGPDDPSLQAAQEQAKGEAKLSVEQQQKLPAQRRRLESSVKKNDQLLGIIDRVLPRVNSTTAGPLGSVSSYAPGSPGYDVSAELDTLKANLGFQVLQEMRDNSPTGGALGQVTERELGFLQAAKGNIDQAQSPTQLKQSLERLRSDLVESKRDKIDAFARDYGGGTAPDSVQQSDEQSPDNLVNKYLGQ